MENLLLEFAAMQQLQITRLRILTLANRRITIETWTVLKPQARAATTAPG